MKNRTVLKKIVLFSKKHKMPKNFVIVELAFVLMFIYIFSGLKYLLKRCAHFVFPNKRVTVSYLLIGCVLCMIAIPKGNSVDDEKVYGDVINTDVQSGTFSHETDQKADSETESDTMETADHLLGTAQENLDQQNTENNLSQGNVYTEEELLGMTFYIKVNRLMNCLTIYTQDVDGQYTIPVKAMRCSTGGENTPLGIFNTSQKYSFRKLLFGVYGQYATRIVDQILFHSSSYSEGKKDKLIPEEYNKLGEGVSHGCIRLTVADAKWIYDYCKEGTTVEIYDDPEVGPLGKPDTITIPEQTEWDPTDPDENNPWNDKTPDIIGTNDKVIRLGETADLTTGVYAYDTCGNDITDQLVIQGNINYQNTGSYQVTYQIADILGKSTSKTITVTIE